MKVRSLFRFPSRSTLALAILAAFVGIGCSSSGAPSDGSGAGAAGGGSGSGGQGGGSGGAAGSQGGGRGGTVGGCGVCPAGSVCLDGGCLPCAACPTCFQCMAGRGGNGGGGSGGAGAGGASAGRGGAGGAGGRGGTTGSGRDDGHGRRRRYDHAGTHGVRHDHLRRGHAGLLHFGIVARDVRGQRLLHLRSALMLQQRELQRRSDLLRHSRYRRSPDGRLRRRSLSVLPTVRAGGRMHRGTTVHGHDLSGQPRSLR